MPSTYDAVRARWTDDIAYACLIAAGIKHKGGYYVINKALTPREWEALQYLCEEWDYAYTLAPGFKGHVSWYYEVPAKPE